MTDLTALSDADLLALARGNSATPAAKPLSEMTDDELRAAHQAVSIPMDVIQSAGSEAAKSFVNTPRAIRDLPELPTRALTWIAEHVLPEGVSSQIKGAREALQGLYAPDTIDRATAKVEAAIPQHEPETKYGEYAKTAGEFVGSPLSYLGPGSIVAKILTATTGGVGSEAAGQATKGSKYEELARLLGGAAGAAGPSAAARVVTPLPISARRQALVDTLTHEGIQPTAGQITGRPALRYAESALGDYPGAGGQAARAQERSAEQFTEAAMGRTGEVVRAAPDEPILANPERMTAARDRIAGEFNDLSARNTLIFDQPFANEIHRIATDYGRTLPVQQREIVANYIQDLTNAAAHPPGGLAALPGEIYQRTRSRLSAQSNAMRQADGHFSRVLGEMRDALDAAMERSIQATNPADAGAWAAARRQYGNMRDIERGAAASGEQAAEGLLSPMQLRTGLASGANRGRYARGEGNLGPLVRAGNAILRPLPQSGSMPRVVSAAIPSAIGSAAGALTGGPPGAALGSMAGVAAPAAIGRLLMSRPAQAYLGNQLLSPAIRDHSTRAAIARALLADAMSER